MSSLGNKEIVLINLIVLAPQRFPTRFFTGNNVIDTAAAGGTGAALGVATQYFANQIFNPCRNNNRIFGGQTLQNGALGFTFGFSGASLVHNALGSPRER